MASDDDLKVLLGRHLAALEKEPESPFFHVVVAETLARAGRIDEALGHYRTAARIHVNLGEYADAAGVCGEVLRLAPQDTAARSLLDGMRRRGLLAAEEPATSGGGASSPAARGPLAPEALLQLSGRRVALQPGEMVLAQGTEGTDLLVVLDGELEVSRQKLVGSEQLLERVGAGAFVGELGLFGDGRQHANVRARGAGTVLSLSKGEVLRLARADAEVNRTLRLAYRDRLERLLMACSPLLAALDPEVAERLVRDGRPRAVAADTVLIAAGDPVDGLHFVLLGQAEAAISVPGPEPRRRVLAQLTDGDCFDALALERGEAAQITVRSLTFCQLLWFPADRILDLGVAAPEFGRRLRREAERAQRLLEACLADGT
ncbi:MAG: cyclic nucleotide-binding domain-containing protein [Deltaproteobacteria bacterium]|nr:cyclic nucleotide-binding domain-containing protein [Deltaproteobacteria bacterium]